MACSCAGIASQLKNGRQQVMEAMTSPRAWPETGLLYDVTIGFDVG
jgi:hypothetical protein